MAFPCIGSSDTMNMNPLLLGNIRTTDYFKNLAEIKTFNDFVDQVALPPP